MKHGMAIGMIGLTGLVAAASDPVLDDWSRQEACYGRAAGSEAAFAEVARKGLLLADDLHQSGREAEARSLRDALASTARRFAAAPAPAPNAGTRDGWHLMRASACRPDSPGFTPGKDYAYRGRAMKWHEREVVFTARDLPPSATLKVRCGFYSDHPRRERVSANGRVLGEVEIAADADTEGVWTLPEGAVNNGVLELRVAILKGHNAVVSAIEVWSDKPAGPGADPERERYLASAGLLRAGDEQVAVYREARSAVRAALFRDPALTFDELLFVKRHWPTGRHQCAHRVGEHQTPGADLCILKGLRPDGAVRGLLPPELAAACGVGRPDLSFDGKTLVFPLARPRTPPTPYRWAAGHAAYDPANPADSAAYRGGACQMYDIWTVGVDGGGLRNLTRDEAAEDTEPCWLPDGRICFTSSRDNRLVQCGDWALVFGLFTCRADGSEVCAITQPQDTEFYPAMLDDGRILYTRWDYVMKAYNVIQVPWVVNPDGTRAQMAYGDWYRFSRGPIALQEARQIPGTRKIVATGAAHHNTCAGPVMVADLNQSRGGPEGLVNLTPEIRYPEVHALLDERADKARPDALDHPVTASGWYASPWPLSERLFLVSHSLEANDNADAYGIYLIDRHGNCELVHRLDGFSCYAPMPLQARPRPAVIPPMPQHPAGTPARLYVQDVNVGLEGVPRGTVKWLRICESYPKRRHTNPHRSDLGVGCGWDTRGVLGVVPVEPDGSANFEVPSDRMLFFSALDENYLEVRRMRNYVNLRPGESQGCIGCHEQPGSAVAPAAGRTAFAKPPEAIRPAPFGAGPISFTRVVQPVLDRHCVGCHDGSGGEKKAFDLRGRKQVAAPHAGDRDEGPQHCVSDAFLALLPHVRYVKVTGYAGEKLPLAPYAYGSAVSPLMRMLKAGHNRVALPEADWRALAAWIDCNAPYTGDYDEEIVLTPTAPEPHS
jgi:hypothetical protein